MNGEIESATAPQTKAMTLVNRACPVCGTANNTNVFAEANVDFSTWDKFSFSSRKLPDYTHYRLLLCSTCELLFANPIPSLDTLAQNYREADFDSNKEATYASRTYGKLVEAFMKKLPDLEGALDIGTGTGSFLEELLTLGFTSVAGVEPSHAPIQAAKPHIRPLIHEKLFDPKDFAAGSLSLVTCFQTLEHLYDPAAMATSAYQLLKQDGAVLFVFHNREALSAKLLGLKSPIFDIEHLQLFSPASATYMLKSCGFSHIECNPIFNSYPLAYWIRLLPFPLTIKNGLIKTLNATGLGSIAVPLPAGNFAAVAYKKSTPSTTR